MDTLTNEEALLSVSRSAVTLTGEKPIRDTSDDLDAIREVDYQADDNALASQVGEHGSYSFSMHVLNLPPRLYIKKQRRRNPGISLPETAVKLEVRTEARFRWPCRRTSYKSGLILRTLSPLMRLRILEPGSGLSKARHSDGGKRRKELQC
jgi:hypothetical protein